jgi:transcriptional regulator with XRE-family HTH domain
MNSHTPDLLLGRRLRQERLLAGKSPEALAEAVGIDSGELDGHERGSHRLDARMLVAVASALGLPMSFLFYDEGAATSPLAADGALARWLARPRPPAVLESSSFARAAPLIELWRASRGRLSGEVATTLGTTGLLHRAVLARRLPHSSRLVFEHLGAEIRAVHPCESLNLIGRGMEELYDRDYGAWTAARYAEALAGDRVRVAAVRAQIHLSAALATDGRYDRILLPWRERNDRFVMGVSLRRELKVLARESVGPLL